MAGTKNGGKAAAEKNKSKYGPDFYARIGSLGGKVGRTGGFASDKMGIDGLTGRQRAAIAGSVGGRISRRTKKIA
jgi:outer membrane lipoprotein SlyB